MSDDPRDRENEDFDDEAVDGEQGGGDLLPADDKGLGLTEEFARIEAEIDAEIGRTGDPLAGAEPGEEDDEIEDDSPGEPAIRWDDDDDSSEWVVPPLAGEADEVAADVPDDGGTEEWATADEPVPDPAPEAAESPADVEEPGITDPPTVLKPPAQPVAPAQPVDEPASEHTVIRPSPLVPISARGGGGGEYIPDEELANTTPKLWWRFTAASVLIVASIATAVALSSLLTLNGIAQDLNAIRFRNPNTITEIDPGKPQTILIVGSDKRSNTPGDPGRSDTTMLLRVDADNEVLSLFSLPRDLKVDIAGRNFGPSKLNEAFTDGGIQKTTETVKNLTGLDINHVVNVDFQGFADAVDAIGCVYVDVDRHYFNDNSTALSVAETFAAINVNAGYQRLCGQNALDYVRYRHTDNDFVRAARQQDFLRNARAQVPVKEVLPIIGGDTGGKLIDIFTKYTSSDIRDPAQVISVLKAFIGVRDVPIKEVHFSATDTVENGIAYVEASDSQIKKAVTQFLGEEDTSGGPSNAPTSQKEQAKPESKKQGSDAGSSSEPDVTDLVPIDDSYAGFGRTSARRLGFPVYIPQQVAPESLYVDDSRQYDIKDTDDKKQSAYKMVVQLTSNIAAGQYYGIEGTTWEDPPILDNPSETISKDGRDYDLYYDGDRLRIVAFHDGDGNSYWVSNTLLQTLGDSQMMAIAESMQEAHG